MQEVDIRSAGILNKNGNELLVVRVEIKPFDTKGSFVLFINRKQHGAQGRLCGLRFSSLTRIPRSVVRWLVFFMHTLNSTLSGSPRFNV